MSQEQVIPPNGNNNDDDDDEYGYGDYGVNHVLLVLGILATGLALILNHNDVGYLLFLGAAFLLM